MICLHFQVRILPLVPSLVVFLSKNELVKEYDLSSVMYVNSGASPLSVEADAEFKEKLPTVPMLRQGTTATHTFSIIIHLLEKYL